jgi:hypothetical protein
VTSDGTVLHVKLGSKLLTYYIEWPQCFPIGGHLELLPKSPLLDIPRRSLDLYHVHVDYQLVGVPLALALFVESPASFTFESPLASVEAGEGRVVGGTGQKKRVRPDGGVY